MIRVNPTSPRVFLFVYQQGADLVVEWVQDVVCGKTKRAAPPYFAKFLEAWVAGYDAVLRNAPVLVVAYAPKEATNGMVDLILALSYRDLMAPAMGLGTCWAGLLKGQCFHLQN